MPITQITLKHNKHRVHPCPSDKKTALLNLLIEQNAKLDILVATAQNSALIIEALNNDNIKVFNDEELSKMPELRCELLISYDLPQDPLTYLARIAKATEGAAILLDVSEQKELYPIETLLKRVIRQEIVEGFVYEEQKMKIAPKPAQKREYAFNPEANEKPKYEKKKFDKPKYDRPKKDGEKSERKVFDKPKYDRPKRDEENKDKKFNKFAKSDKKPNKFLGKDENGKAKFSGKSGERNHRYDGKPKDAPAPKSVGRVIPIKERKEKKSEEPNS